MNNLDVVMDMDSDMSSDIKETVVKKLGEIERVLSEDLFTTKRRFVESLVEQLIKSGLVVSTDGSEIVDLAKNRICYKYSDYKLLGELRVLYEKLVKYMSSSGYLLVCSDTIMEDKYLEVYDAVKHIEQYVIKLNRANEIGMFIDVESSKLFSLESSLVRAIYKITDNIMLVFELFHLP